MTNTGSVSNGKAETPITWKWITTRKRDMRTKKLEPIHPGEHLADILKEAGISAHALALRLRVPANRITMMIHGKRSITAETALRLAQYFRTSPEFWMNFQSKYDLAVAQDAI